jgi:signal transduction histidine kinase
LEEFKSMTIKDIRPKNHLEFLEKSLEERKREDQDIYAGVFYHTLKSSKTICVEIYSNDFEYEGRMVRLVLASDITEKQKYIGTIETQNKKLRDIAWTQSHVVRAPLSRLLGVINLLDLEPNYSEDVPFLLEQIKVSGKELDKIIQDIVSKTRSMDINTLKNG